jgi:hypothetical protein
MRQAATLLDGGVAIIQEWKSRGLLAYTRLGERV